MEAIKEPDWNTVGVLGAARGGALGTDEKAIGTEHLLAGIATAKGAAREALAAEGVTKIALTAVLRDKKGRADAWSGADDAEGSAAAQDVMGEHGDKRDRFTGAAARALTTAMEQAQREGAAKFGAVHLLRALLAEEDNRAVELLSACGVSPQSVRDRLDGGDGDDGGGTAGRDDDLDPLLHATRDVLLGRGRGHYRHLPFWKRWLVKNAGINLASKPAWWVQMETYDQARRLGNRTVGTEHILLAILATHEVALRYPHLAAENAPAPDTRYAGGERLARLGIDYASVHSALTGDRVQLTADARPVERYLDVVAGPRAGRLADADSLSDSGTGSDTAVGSDSEPVADPGTGPLVEILLREKTRARQLVDALTANPGD
ncbi:Clp protease N-terminal domain-containing protein [Streptomyces sp. NPDC050704]|uniref:Clp protease N-terminal domain-containing protein n=1 Tax=Streptomyces sp. NPDC050704 TaxID=3157219 RepID=UPI00342258ED